MDCVMRGRKNRMRKVRTVEKMRWNMGNEVMC